MLEKVNDNNILKAPSVLISGGSGMVGMYLTSALLERGYKVSHLSRNTNQFGKVRVFRWDPEQGILDPLYLEGVDFIVHLSGANLGEKPWTKKRKEEIINSRVEPALLLHKVIRDNEIDIKSFISASGVGYYGSKTTGKIFNEDDPPSDDFSSKTCIEWEKAADAFEKDGIRTVKIRTAVVLAKESPALLKLMTSAKFGFLTMIGNGRQFFPWIHIQDLCNIYIKAIEDILMTGPYNAVSPQHTTHKEFIEMLSHSIGRPVAPVAVPAIALRAVYGEMSDIVLKGSRISSEKIKNAGYEFVFDDLHYAFHDILRD